MMHITMITDITQRVIGITTPITISAVLVPATGDTFDVVATEL